MISFVSGSLLFTVASAKSVPAALVTLHRYCPPSAGSAARSTVIVESKSCVTPKRLIIKELSGPPEAEHVRITSPAMLASETSSITSYGETVKK